MFVTQSCKRDSTFVLVRFHASSRTFCMMDNCGNATCVQESVIICLLLRFLYVFPFYLSKVKGNQAFIRNENQRKSIILQQPPSVLCTVRNSTCVLNCEEHNSCTFSHTSFNQHTKVVKLRFIVFSTFFHKITENQSN